MPGLRCSTGSTRPPARRSIQAIRRCSTTDPLIVRVRGPMLAMASQRGEVVARAVAEECGVRVVMSFAAAAQRPRENGRQ